jgi:hypothetical protein
VAGPEAPAAFLATVNQVACKELSVQCMTHRPAFLVTTKHGAPASHEVPTTLNYLPGLPETPFRPAKVGPYLVRRVDASPDGVLITTDGGCIQLPAALVAISYST